MKLTVLGSGSKGNCYVLHSDSEALIIEVGVRYADIVRAIDYKSGNIVGAIVSHEHGDHAQYVGGVTKHGIPVFTTTSLKEKFADDSYVHAIKPRRSFRLGCFHILPLPTKHDVECLSFLVYHDQMGRLLFATDTPYIEYTAVGLNHIMIEANYSKEKIRKNLDNGVITQAQYDRVTLNHMSIDTCIETLKANDLTDVRNIILLHLSADNSEAGDFLTRVSKATRKDVYIASKGVEVELSKEPF